MKKFIQLTIKHPDAERLKAFMSSLSDAKGYPFSYQKQASAEYAKNVFLDKGEAACFKTGRKSLFESTVWVVLTGNSFVVTNITSTINTNLGITNYNSILNTFFFDFVSKFIDGTFEVFKTGEVVSLEEIISADAFQVLKQWEATCDKLSPYSHFVDRARWFDFIVLTHDNGDELAPNDLSTWLIEDCNWSTPALIKSAEDIALSFEFGRDLLNQADLQHETEK